MSRLNDKQTMIILIIYYYALKMILLIGCKVIKLLIHYYKISKQ
jgi:hypothetical protein